MIEKFVLYGWKTSVFSNSRLAGIVFQGLKLPISAFHRFFRALWILSFSAFSVCDPLAFFTSAFLHSPPRALPCFSFASENTSVFTCQQPFDCSRFGQVTNKRSLISSRIFVWIHSPLTSVCLSWNTFALPSLLTKRFTNAGALFPSQALHHL